MFKKTHIPVLCITTTYQFDNPDRSPLTEQIYLEPHQTELARDYVDDFLSDFEDVQYSPAHKKYTVRLAVSSITVTVHPITLDYLTKENIR